MVSAAARLTLSKPIWKVYRWGLEAYVFGLQNFWSSSSSRSRTHHLTCCATSSYYLIFFIYLKILLEKFSYFPSGPHPQQQINYSGKSTHSFICLFVSWFILIHSKWKDIVLQIQHIWKVVLSDFALNLIEVVFSFFLGCWFTTAKERKYTWVKFVLKREWFEGFFCGSSGVNVQIHCSLCDFGDATLVSRNVCKLHLRYLLVNNWSVEGFLYVDKGHNFLIMFALLLVCHSYMNNVIAVQIS